MSGEVSNLGIATESIRGFFRDVSGRVRAEIDALKMRGSFALKRKAADIRETIGPKKVKADVTPDAISKRAKTRWTSNGSYGPDIRLRMAKGSGTSVRLG